MGHMDSFEAYQAFVAHDIETRVRAAQECAARYQERIIRRAFANEPIFLETVLATGFFPPTGVVLDDNGIWVISR